LFIVLYAIAFSLLIDSRAATAVPNVAFDV